MKHHTILAAMMLASGVLVLQPALADDAHHPDQKAGAATPAADQTIQKMQANTKKMEGQLEKLAKNKDPKERQQLLQQHMQTMMQNAAMAKGMMSMDCPMMSGGMDMGMMGQGGMGMMGGGGPQDPMTNRMQMMEKRMDMMQMMIEQMSRGQQPAMPAK
jgi:hypothetical protein